MAQRTHALHARAWCVGVAVWAWLVPVAAYADDARVPLNVAVERAVEANPVAVQARARVAQSRALQRQTLARLLPRVAFSGRVSRTNAEGGIEGLIDAPRDDWNATVSATIVLFDGSVYPQYSGAESRAQAAEQDAAWARHVLRHDTAQAHVTLRAAQDALKIVTEVETSRRADVKRTETLRDAGLALDVDVARVRDLLLQAERERVLAEADVETASDALAVLLGDAIGAVALRAEPASLPRATPNAPSPATTLQALADRPDVRALAQAMQATEATERSVWWQYAPIVDVDMEARNSSIPNFATGQQDARWTLGLNVTWLLYDGGDRSAQLDGARALRSEQEALRRDALRRARAEARRALRQWRAVSRGESLAETRVEVAEQAYQQVRARFERGLASSLELSDASRALLQARLGRNQARLEVDRAWLQLLFAVGAAPTAAAP